MGWCRSPEADFGLWWICCRGGCGFCYGGGGGGGFAISFFEYILFGFCYRILFLLLWVWLNFVMSLFWVFGGDGFPVGGCGFRCSGGGFAVIFFLCFLFIWVLFEDFGFVALSLVGF